MGSKLFAAMLLVILSQYATADVVQPGHINKQFMFTNLERFPGFTYSLLHRGYHYDKGYRPDPIDTLALENNNRYAVSEKGGDRSPLLARDKNGKYYVSDVKFGGAVVVSPSITAIIEVYTIVSIKKGKLKIKKIKEIIVDKEGQEKERKTSSLGAWIGTDGFTSGLAIASTAGLLGLLLLFIFKKRKPKYIQLTA